MSDPVKRYDCTSGGAQWCQGCYQMTEDDLGDYVKYEDYEKLRERIATLDAEVKQWKKAAQVPPQEQTP